MATISVRVDAAKVNRSLVQNSEPRRIETQSITLSFWVRFIEHTVQDAKKTMHGQPTDSAILARWWLEHRPPQTDAVEWERSFDRACSLLGIDAEYWRRRLLGQIDEAWKRAAEKHVQAVIYVRRAMVLACAGIPTAIARQHLLPLVSVADYEQVAGIDHGDQYVMYDRVDEQAA